MKTLLLIIAMLVGTALPATADDNPLPDEPTAADVAEDPEPGKESGRIDPQDEDDGTLRKIGRGVLFVPRVLVEVGFAPIRAGVYAVDRTSMIDRFRQFFFNKTGTWGLYPIINYDSNYGVNGGARFVHRDLFGEKEKVSLKASAGGRFSGRIEGYVRSGERLGDDLTAELHGEFDRRPRESFWGIGNGDDMPRGRHRQQLARATATVDYRVAGPFHVLGAGALTQLRYLTSEQRDIGTDAPIDMVYDTTTLTGWNGVQHLYTELELRWDDRRNSDKFDIRDIPTDGWLLSGFVGRVHQFGAPTDYTRLGTDLQRFFKLGEGPRVLQVRLHGEMVTGGYDEVPFTLLPELGGGMLLRGYAWDRFRDRVATLGSVEYQWDLSDRLTMSLFADGGRVYPSLREMEFKDMRLGFGTGLQLHNSRGYVAGITFASSIDGGFFVDVLFDPVYEVKPRVVHR